MKKLLPILLFVVISITTSKFAIAQDKILLRNKPDTLIVKILEIGTEEVKYKLWPVEEDMPIMVQPKDRIRKIFLSNGTSMRFDESDFVNAENYVDQNKKAIKMDLFSILSGAVSFSYEQSIQPGSSWEAGVGIIGVNNGASGEQPDRNGAFFRGGYKFINTPDYYTKGMRYMHVMKGAYIRPEIVASFYNEKTSSVVNNYNWGIGTNTYYTIDKTERYSAAAFMLNFGKQWVFSDIFLVDAFVGLGIGGGGVTTVSETQSAPVVTTSYYYGSYNYYSEGINGRGLIVDYDGGVNFAAQAGLKLGILFGNNSKK
jgi:hypothetical protein